MNTSFKNERQKQIVCRVTGKAMKTMGSKSGSGTPGANGGNVGANSRRAVRIMSTNDVGKASNGGSMFGKFGSQNFGASFTDGVGEDTKSLHEKMNYVKEELQITQESFISRQRAFNIRIEQLEEALSAKRKEKIGWMDSDPKISRLKSMQAQILSNVALVQDRFSRVVREQEQNLLKAFQTRLLDVQAELEMQKSKKDDGAVAYIELSKVKEYDVEKEKVRADLKERQNQALLQANSRLKNQFASREEDRNFLVLQINMARTDNARLRAEYNEYEAENTRLKQQLAEQSERLNVSNTGTGAGTASANAPNRKGLTSAQTLQLKIDTEERYSKIVVMLCIVTAVNIPFVVVEKLCDTQVQRGEQ
jgi:hypothetical protein